MKKFKFILLLFYACSNNNYVSNENSKSNCKYQEDLKIINKNYNLNSFIIQSDSILNPNFSEEKTKEYELNKNDLSKILNSINVEEFCNNNEFEINVYLQYAPKGFKDSKECNDKIFIYSDSIEDIYKITIRNEYLVPSDSNDNNNWCNEEQISYLFKLQNDSVKIISIF